MPTKTPLGREELYARELNRQLYERATGVAAVLQTPPQAGAVSEDKEFSLWMQTDPKVDVVVLVQQGATAAEATLAKYPYRSMLLTNEKPKLVQRVAYANRMKARADKLAASQQQVLVDQPDLPALDHLARNQAEPDLAHPYFVTPHATPPIPRVMNHDERTPPHDVPKADA